MQNENTHEEIFLNHRKSRLALIFSVLFSSVILGCVGIKSITASVPYFETTGDWEVVAETTNIINKKTGITITISPLNTRNDLTSAFFVHIGSFQKPGQLVVVDLQKVILKYDGKEIIGDGWLCKYPVKTERTTPIKYYSSDQGCALVRFGVVPPQVSSQFTIDIGAVFIDGHPVNIQPISFREGVVRFRGSF